LVVEGVT